MPNRVLVIFVDALGEAQLERFGESLSYLPHRRSLDGVLGYSSGALATVLTGASGAEHGRMCLFSARKEEEPGILKPLSWLGVLPRILHERAALRRALARALSLRRGLTGYVALHRVPPEAFRWLDLPEREDIFSADEIGGVPTFLSRAREAGLSVYASPWQLPEPRRWESIHQTLESSTPDLAFLYAAELDGILHAEGNDGSGSRSVRLRIAEHLERARTAMLRGGGSLLTILVGDHGMADVRETLDPRKVVSRIGARVFVDSTMLRLWGDDNQLLRARLEIERAKFPGSWLDTHSLEERRAPVKGSPYGQALFLLNEGIIFAPSYVGGKARGMHGYDLPSVSARAAMASDRPLPETIRALTDLSPMITSALGLA